jgi:ribonucleoside-diphosphate reductase alpha chain
LLLNDLYKDVIKINEFDGGFNKIYKDSFREVVQNGVLANRLDPRLLEFDFAKLSPVIEPARDQFFEYLGIQTLYDRYFLKDHSQKILELPQHFWMRVAMGLSFLEKNKEESAILFYNAISRLLYVPSTPTLFHSGTTHPQMSSCYLTTVEDDLGHIFKAIADNAQLSKWSGGLGNDWSNIRATGALIKSTNVGSQGVVPFLKIVDSTTAAINRSGKRRGATCVYLETWHYDIEDFLELRKNTGDDRRRTHDTNTANWIPDLFIKRVMEDGDWTLFSPHEVPDLHHTYGKDFENRYVAYERKAERGEIQLWKRVKAQALWRKMITMIFETGHPWITFKDPCNVRSPQDHVGVVHSSNLCTEITLNTSKDETAVCNLGSINVVRHIVGGKLDKDLLRETAKTAIRMLDNVVDINFYPTVEAKNANLKHRPVGMGIMGLQDAFYKLGLDFDSERAVNFSDELMEYISYYVILGSSEIAKEKGTYASYKGSKWDRGLLPIDTLKVLEEERGIPVEVSRHLKMNWTPVREHIKQYGMRNSNTMAIAPTATIANIAGCLPSIEPIYKNLYVKSNVSGDFTVVNSALVDDLKKLGLWTETMLEKLKYYDGSLQHITEIPEGLRKKYKEAFEVAPLWVVKHAAARGKWIDQSQSINIFTSTDSGKELSDIYLTAWKAGLKTTYYLRTLGASGIEKSTIDINKKFEGAATPAVSAPRPKVRIVGEVCESCQ